ncbi:MAG: tetratricopeptide repeat protein [Terriglobia bacterium]
MAVRMRTSPPDNCIACHMPGQKPKTISHAALANHRIIAYSSEPFPEAGFHMTTPGLPDLVFLDREPGEERLSSLVILQAYEGLRPENTAYRAPEQRLLDRLAKTEPNNPIVLSALRHMAVDEKKFSESQQDMRRAIAAGSSKASDLDLYGRLLIHSGQMAQAVTVLKRDIALHPYSTQRYKMLALAYIKLQDDDHALDTVERELELFPQDSVMRALFEWVSASSSASPK